MSPRSIILLCLLSSITPAVAGQLVLLDGRWVRGAVAERRDGFVVVHGRAGTLTFPEWQIDERAVAPRIARITGARDRILAARVRELPLERDREADVRRALHEVEQKVRDDRAARDTSALRRTCRSLESKLRRARDDIERGLVRALLADVLRSLAETLPAESRDERLAAARAYFAAHCADYSGGTGQTWKIRDVLQPSFETDPWQWGPLVELIEQSEAWDVRFEWRGGWLWDSDGVTWPADPQHVPETYRVVRAAGSTVRDRLPAGPEGVLSAWKAAVRSRATGDILMTNLGGVTVYERHGKWRRLFWCPVEGRFCEESVPEKLARARLEVWSRLAALRSRESAAVASLQRLVRSYRVDVDNLARPGVDLKQVFSTASGRDRLVKINAGVAEIRRALSRSLEERAAMQPWFDRLRELDDLLARASRGERVDVPAIPPR